MSERGQGGQRRGDARERWVGGGHGGGLGSGAQRASLSFKASLGQFCAWITWV